MATLSSLTGGSGGGGGDPTAKFQAATVANGDLLVLNANGTVAASYFYGYSFKVQNFTRSDNGTATYGNNGNPASTYASLVIHMFITKMNKYRLCAMLVISTF